ncbi:MAG: hypothetical protein DME99_07515 [Verrucomicrobia bacterium]|nr:MAG: hypothetical protein DME99_07515 [Verrucomicrobiota bacterium]
MYRFIALAIMRVSQNNIPLCKLPPFCAEKASKQASVQDMGVSWVTFMGIKNKLTARCELRL